MKKFFGVLTLLLITLTGKVFAAGNEILIVRVAQNSSLMVQVNSAMDPMTIDVLPKVNLDFFVKANKVV